MEFWNLRDFLRTQRLHGSKSTQAIGILLMLIAFAFLGGAFAGGGVISTVAALALAGCPAISSRNASRGKRANKTDGQGEIKVIIAGIVITLLGFCGKPGQLIRHRQYRRQDVDGVDWNWDKPCRNRCVDPQLRRAKQSGGDKIMKRATIIFGLVFGLIDWFCANSNTGGAGRGCAGSHYRRRSQERRAAERRSPRQGRSRRNLTGTVADVAVADSKKGLTARRRCSIRSARTRSPSTSRGR